MLSDLKEMPAALGQWGEIYVYSPLDKKTHKAYLRVTAINTDKTATKTILDNYNRINGATNQVPTLKAASFIDLHSSSMKPSFVDNFCVYCG